MEKFLGRIGIADVCRETGPEVIFASLPFAKSGETGNENLYISACKPCLNVKQYKRVF